jgi:thiamine biosynthesis lipoprotein
MHWKRFGLLLSALLLTRCTADAASWQETDLFAMDTYMHMKIWSDDQNITDRAAAEILRREDLFSAVRDGSDIQHINEAHGQPVTVDPETAQMIAEALEIGKESGGALNIALYPVSQLWDFKQETPHVPEADAVTAALTNTDQSQIRLDGTTVTVPDGMALDLGCIAKGYTAARVKDFLQENGVKTAMLSLGGNVEAIGTKPDGTPWQIGIADPFAPDQTICTFRSGAASVVTSGSYQRYFEADGRRWHHIIDPETGYPADNGLVSVTVIGSDGMECDALSTALFVMGKDRAIDLWQDRTEAGKGFGLILITDEPAFYHTEGIDFVQMPDIPVTVIPREDAD